MSEYDNIIITAEETCQILHISKRKCAWMLQNGMIPCLDSGKKTSRYTILLKDVLDFKDDYEAHPNKYFIPVTFSTSKTSNPRRRNPYYLTQDKVPLDFRDWLVDEWFDLNDIVTPKEVGEILGYHGVLHKAFKDAVKRRIIPANPVDQATRPKREQFIADYYNGEEIKKLLEIAKNDEIYIPILLTAYYGLRRSEVLGIKWSAIDFTENMITIRHTVHSGKDGPIGKDRLKTKSSYRTLPLLPMIREELLKHQQAHTELRRVMRKAYTTEYSEYVCVDALGQLYDPDFITTHFSIVLKRNNLKKIRFHDLRHSCASLLVAQGVSMKLIQEWLGHSDMNTTANIYSHVDSVSKMETGNVIGEVLGGKN
ncbi:MAG: site-specific integrase [Clostridia bacterium]|nr:site-specific integrase [Clostridia bacterium]